MELRSPPPVQRGMTTHYVMPTPCQENWNAMSPTERGRHCDSCRKEVVDLSQLTRAEAEQRMRASQAQQRADAHPGVCGRAHNDGRGRVVFFGAVKRYTLTAGLAAMLAFGGWGANPDLSAEEGGSATPKPQPVAPPAGGIRAVDPKPNPPPEPVVAPKGRMEAPAKMGELCVEPPPVVTAEQKAKAEADAKAKAVADAQAAEQQRRAKEKDELLQANTINRLASWEFKDVPLKKALEKIAADTGVPIAYPPKLGILLVTSAAKNVTLGAGLPTLFTGAQVERDGNMLRLWSGEKCAEWAVTPVKGKALVEDGGAKQPGKRTNEGGGDSF